jgi:hypothetical protein
MVVGAEGQQFPVTFRAKIERDYTFAEIKAQVAELPSILKEYKAIGKIRSTRFAQLKTLAAQGKGVDRDNLKTAREGMTEASGKARYKLSKISDLLFYLVKLNCCADVANSNGWSQKQLGLVPVFRRKVDSAIQQIAKIDGKIPSDESVGVLMERTTESSENIVFNLY